MSNNNLATLDELCVYRRRFPAANLIADTNILLLFLLGASDCHYLPRCPLMTDNGKNYAETHFELINRIFRIFLYKIVITPEILAEVNMLLRSRVKPKEKMFSLFFSIVKELERCQEEHVDFKIILKNGDILRFGFADISLVEAARSRGWAIITDEFSLYARYRSSLPVIYFSNLVASEILSVRL